MADYLLNEILDRQPDRLREFLLRTSVPDTISAGLADALTGRRDGARVLAELAGANFLVSGYSGSRPATAITGCCSSSSARSCGGRARTTSGCSSA